MSKVKVTYRDGTTETVGANHFQRPTRRGGLAAARRTPYWHNLGLQALDRDDNRCVDCRGTHKLEIHHLTYVRLGKERLDDVVTLCQRCHATRHQWAKRLG